MADHRVVGAADEQLPVLCAVECVHVRAADAQRHAEVQDEVSDNRLSDCFAVEDDAYGRFLLHLLVIFACDDAEQPLACFAAGVGEHIVDAALFGNHTAVENRDVGADLTDDCHFMGDNDDGDAHLPVDFLQQAEDGLRRHGVKGAGCFVAEQHFGVTGEGAGDGDALALTAMLLDGVSGGLAGAIGLALADVVAGDPGYAVTTFILKFIIGITCGAVAHKVFKLRELDKHTPGYLAKVIVAAASGLLLNVFTDPFLGYFRNVYIFGQEYTIAKALTKITGGVTFVNSVASTVCVVILYLALRPALERANLLPRAEKKADK